MPITMKQECDFCGYTRDLPVEEGTGTLTPEVGGWKMLKHGTIPISMCSGCGESLAAGGHERARARQEGRPGVLPTGDPITLYVYEYH